MEQKNTPQLLFRKLNVAVIPARAGSKRLPGKNIKPFCGKPLIYYTIAFAINSRLFDHVVVSTDSQEIAAISREFGAKVIIRPNELAMDSTTIGPVLKHALEVLSEKYDAIITLQPTNPFRKVSTMKDALKEFSVLDGDSLISVSPNHRKLGIIKMDRYQPINYNVGQRSQDLSQQVYENGLFYISNQKVVEEGDVFGRYIIPFKVVDNGVDIDIDTAWEFKMAENLYQYNSELIDL